METLKSEVIITGPVMCTECGHEELKSVDENHLDGLICGSCHMRSGVMQDHRGMKLELVGMNEQR